MNTTELSKVEAVLATLPPESSLGAALQRVTESVRRGVDVTIAPNDSMVTPAQAAELLRMSRTHLYKLMDAGVVGSVSVGRDRRIAIGDLVDYDTRRHGERASLAERFAHSDRDRQALVEQLATEPPA